MGDYEDDQPEYEMEAKAFERAGPGGKLNELLSAGADIEKASPEDRILIAIQSIFIDKFMGEGYTYEQLDDILETASKFSDLRYKNPSAIILGYIGSGGGSKLTTKNMEKAFQSIQLLNANSGIEPPDVVRYSRLWNSVK